MKIANLTPHPLNLVGLDPIPPSGIARAQETPIDTGDGINGTPVLTAEDDLEQARRLR